ncbi:sodium-dependent bicarbonate transport family permease [Zeimonas arvi]|uniref:Sodium-dependent bicarbonate transport family permease n=1 Tax=Zeimonas arvi TaxID=2498847 RepID=A0A5C8NMW4_9BURK|nr:sodium-dependent bicarbonate transport family permease [Zeimonas arvi]TXL62420.1 sodium-dependent bicarbonate transport family permease [Zeimonas arvi]
MTLDPVVLFFLLGVGARLARSDLRLPDALYETLSIYLLLAIGLKGGVELARQDLWSLLPVAFTAFLLSATIPLIAFPLLRGPVGLPRADAASIAAHYGSVSVVTFAVAQSVLARAGVEAPPEFAVLVAIMEAPGIVVGILLARGLSGGQGPAAGWGVLLHDALFGKAVYLLLGGLLIGALVGEAGMAPLRPLFGDLFRGALALFLLEMGLVAGGRLGDLRRAGPRLVAFGLLAPLLFGAIGLGAGLALGLGAGGVTLLATLAASASYIAAPAAMRVAVPEANPALSIGAALGVTFPFNVTIGVGLYLWLAQRLTS